MKRKNFAMIQGIILHPVKMLLFRLNGGKGRYNTLTKRANERTKEKAHYRTLYLASITKTNINL